MLRRQSPGWEPYKETLPHEPGRWRWLATAVAGALLVVMAITTAQSFTAGMSGRGWLTFAGMAALVALLGFRRVESFGAALRAMAEYIVVALLAVLLVSGSAHQPPGKPPPARSDAAGQTADGCPSVVQVREWLTCLWDAGQEASRRIQPPSTATPSKGHALAPSPTPPTRRCHA